MIDPRESMSASLTAIPKSRSGAGRPTRGGSKTRRFYIIRGKNASRASGFEVLNGDKLVRERGSAAFLPPPMVPLQDYLVRPVFLANAKLGRIHRDFEIFSGYWFVSEKMKSVLQAVDREAFALLECDVQSPDGNRQPARWLCNVVRVLDAVDEAQSTVKVGVADNGSKCYRLRNNDKLVFKDSVVGGAHVFRMKYFEPRIICDEELKRACKLADLEGISFVAQSK
jgi:hypothetical protein